MTVAQGIMTLEKAPEISGVIRMNAVTELVKQHMGDQVRWKEQQFHVQAYPAL